eukprot:557948-Hanusia_phi.AAC.1
MPLTAGKGFYQVYGSSVCNKCPAGSYCVGGTAKADCPAHSSRCSPFPSSLLLLQLVISSFPSSLVHFLRCCSADPTSSFLLFLAPLPPLIFSLVPSFHPPLFPCSFPFPLLSLSLHLLPPSTHSALLFLRSGEQSRSLQDCSCVAGYYGEPQNCRKCPA